MDNEDSLVAEGEPGKDHIACGAQKRGEYSK